MVSTQQGQDLANELNIPFLEVSAKSNINIERAFYSLASDIKKRLVDSSRNDAATGGAAGSGSGVQIDSVGGMGNGIGGKCC